MVYLVGNLHAVRIGVLQDRPRENAMLLQGNSSFSRGLSIILHTNEVDRELKFRAKNAVRLHSR